MGLSVTPKDSSLCLENYKAGDTLYAVSHFSEKFPPKAKWSWKPTTVPILLRVRRVQGNNRDTMSNWSTLVLFPFYEHACWEPRYLQI